MGNYKPILNQLLDEFEGFSSKAYEDPEGNPTIGHGINLNEPENKAMLSLSGKNPDALISGTEKITPEESLEHREYILNRKEREIRSKLGNELFDTLSPNEKAAVMSMGYNSMNILGPKLKEYMSDPNKKIEALHEIMLRSNAAQDPGIQVRRLKEAEIMGDPITFSGAFKTMSSEDKQKILNNLQNIQNEHRRKDVLEKYQPYLNTEIAPPKFHKINRLLK